MGKRDITKIITGKMVAIEKGQLTFRQHIQAIYDDLNRTGALVIDLHINDIDTGNFVQAFIDFGRWGARCPDCEGGAEYVDPDDPVFYCFGCGNVSAGGKLRPVQFPPNREDIELLLLERPISVHSGITKSQICLSSQPLAGDAYRNWVPGEDIQKVKDKNKAENLEYDLKKIKARKVVA